MAPLGTLAVLVQKGLSRFASMSAAVYLVLVLASCMPDVRATGQPVPESALLSGTRDWAVITEVRAALREEPDAAAPRRRFIPRGTILPVNTESQQRSRLGGCLAPFVLVTVDDQQWWIHGCEVRRFASQVAARRFTGRLPALPGEVDSL